MGCRIKENPDKIFDWFFEVAVPKSSEDDPEVVRQFPEEFSDQDSIQQFPKFCFPFDIERVKENTVVQNFTFVLTDLEGNQRFGFCRLSVGFKACICILSYLPWFEVFYKLLNNIADHLAKDQLGDLDELLTSLYRHPVPQLHSAVSLEFDPKYKKLAITTGSFLKRWHRDRSKDPRGGTESLSYFIAPDSGGLPTIPESRNLTEFVLAVDVNNMLQLYASMLYERRILITSSKLSTLTACVHASTAMLYPMYWQNIYIPILPPHLLDYCCAPMPYLIGVHASLLEHVRSKALEDVVILNVDSNTLETPFQDLESLPGDVVSLLKLRLKKHSAVTGDGMARAFLRAQALLFGTYREALICTPGDPIIFCEESFLNHKSNAMKQFLQNAVHLQLFKEFIDGRLLKLNSGDKVSDIFEQEIDSCGLCSGSSKSYQLWVENLKKGGGALMHTVKNKANPAVKNMYRYAKGQARVGLKEMRSRLKQKDVSVDRLLRRGGSLRSDHVTDPNQHRRTHDCLQSRLPITQHFGQSRPRRPSKITGAYEENSSWVSESDVSASTEDEPEPAVPPSHLQELEDSFLEQGEIDLLGEIFDTLSMQASSERGMLYGTHSLDFFNLEDSSFIKKLKSINHPSDENLSFSTRRDSEPFQGGRWDLEEEGSLDFLIPSSEEISISEESEILSTQEDQGVSLDNLMVSLANTTADENPSSSQGSGMWDRCIEEEGEMDLQVEVSMAAPGMLRPATPQTVDGGSPDNPERSAEVEVERNWMETEENNSEGSEQKASVCAEITSEERVSPERVPWNPSSAEPVRGRASPSIPGPEIQETPDDTTVSSVLTTVALFQAQAQQKTQRVPASLGNPRPKNSLEMCADNPGGTEVAGAGANGIHPCQPYHAAAGPPSPSWKPPASKLCPSALPKVSELKKRFEA